PFIFTISFSIIALTLSEFFSELVIYFKLSRLGYNIFGFFNQRFLIEFFYNKYITNLILDLGGQMTKILDKGSIELFGPFGLEKGLVNFSKNISSLSTSHVTTYALYILVAFILYLLLFFIFMYFFRLAGYYEVSSSRALPSILRAKLRLAGGVRSLHTDFVLRTSYAVRSTQYAVCSNSLKSLNPMKEF